MKKLKSQSGRSMVEMLGVLAIIGVLSVGGIAGYSLSMRRHRANGIVDSLSKYALVAYAQCQKKFLDGEVKKGYCDNYTNPLDFDDAGIGARPVGLGKEVNFYVSIHEDADTVIISAPLDSDKLCQAVASTGGYRCDDDNFIYITIPQN